MKKKVGVITAVIIVILIVIAAVVVFLRKGGNLTASDNGRIVYVEAVKNICGSSVGMSSRFMGIVESQETKGVEKDSSKTVKELYVAEGDTVNEGDALFKYDTDSMQLDLQQMKLEYENIQNNISSTKTQISDLSKAKDAAAEEDKLSYTSQINNLKSMVKEYEYNLSVKALEIERQNQAIEQAVVTAPMSGIIKSIKKDSNSNSDSYSYGSSQDNAYITIMAVGDYRIKGTATELDIYNLYGGMPMIARSRYDESITWSGAISTIDLEPQQNNSDSYYYGGSSGESASKYSFYVTLDNYDGLFLGQHVYLEMDYGQQEVKEGLNLPSYYVMEEDGHYYVWVKGENERIEKRELDLGALDEGSYTYPVNSGLTEDDYIAYPDDGIEDGLKTTNDYEEAMNSTEAEDMPDDDYYYENDSYIDDNYNTDGEYTDDADYTEGNYTDEWSGDDGIDLQNYDENDASVKDNSEIDVIE